jgi:superfamily II DNA or RNA helicase
MGKEEECMVANSEIVTERPPLVDEAVGLTRRNYQEEGINFLWKSQRAMITDAPGLGKTPQAALAAQVPCIVVCPTYLTEQWGQWLRAHLPNRKVIVAKGNRNEKLEQMLVPADFLVVNKEMLRTHIEELCVIADRYRYKTLIIDESHHLRNRTTTAARGAVALGQIIPRVYLLTATPIWKEADDLFMPLRILHPDVFTSYNQFVDTWCVSDSNRYGTKVYGIKKDMLKPLNDLLDIVRIGRSYEDAGRDLPPIIENIMTLEFNPTEQHRYDEAVNNYRLMLEDNESMFMTSYMEVMHTLRNMTGFEKIEPIKDTVEDTHHFHEGKYVIFTWYRDIAERLHAAIPETVLITGDLKPDERQRLARLQKPIIATIPSLSEGVDMSWARMVIYAEEHWPPGSQVQSLMRVRRERQLSDTSLTDEESREMRRELNSDPILVYCVHVKNSIDEVIHSKSRARAATAKEVLSEALGIYL